MKRKGELRCRLPAGSQVSAEIAGSQVQAFSWQNCDALDLPASWGVSVQVRTLIRGRNEVLYAASGLCGPALLQPGSLSPKL